MDPTTASYYRAILFSDGQEMRPLPPTLVQIHAWAVKRGLAMGIGNMITKQTALAVVMTWMSSTKEGREFASEFTSLGDMFCDQVETDIDWDKIEPETQVVVSDKDKTLSGSYLGRRSGWIDVRVGNEKRTFRVKQVKLAQSGV